MGRNYVRWSLWVVGGSLFCGCALETESFKVRAIESASSKIKGGPSALSEAQGLLHLGNPGLALEAFRKIQRERPSKDALAGIAACYVAMGRDDLAKTNLEAALALAPRSAELLHSVALVMDRLGLNAEAENARLQARSNAAQPASGLAVANEAVVQNMPDHTLPLPAPTQDREIVLKSEPLVPELAPTKYDDRAVVRAVEEARNYAEVRPPSSSVTVKLPPARDASPTQSSPNHGEAARTVVQARRFVDAPRLSSSVTVKLPPARIASAATHPAAPRLERLSAREVMLVTSAKPFWAPTVLKRVQTSYADPQWVALRPSQARPNIRLLNAARIQGLAKSARAGLIERGWRKIAVGDYAAVRARSVVLYPADKRRIGESLARHFGIASAQSKGPTVTIIIGRDLAARLHG